MGEPCCCRLGRCGALVESLSSHVDSDRFGVVLRQASNSYFNFPVVAFHCLILSCFVAFIITQNVTLCQAFSSPFGVFFSLFLIFF